VGRLDPYRVDWRSPSGQWTLGKPLPFERIPVDKRQKEFYRSQYEKHYGEKPSGSRGAPLFFEEELPPYADEKALCASDGRVFVLKNATPDRPENVYDIVNRKSELDGRLVLPDNMWLAGFGPRTAYTLEQDDAGEVWFNRHPWPAVPIKGSER
jgi:hypothetical protein